MGNASATASPKVVDNNDDDIPETHVKRISSLISRVPSEILKAPSSLYGSAVALLIDFNMNYMRCEFVFLWGKRGK